MNCCFISLSREESETSPRCSSVCCSAARILKLLTLNPHCCCRCCCWLELHDLADPWGMEGGKTCLCPPALMEPSQKCKSSAPRVRKHPHSGLEKESRVHYFQQGNVARKFQEVINIFSNLFFFFKKWSELSLLHVRTIQTRPGETCCVLACGGDVTCLLMVLHSSCGNIFDKFHREKGPRSREVG